MFEKNPAHITYSLKELPKIANNFAQHLTQKNIILLNGELGAGKTTFVKHIVACKGGDQRLVTSPTFNIMHVYDVQDGLISHFDLYRIKNEIELDNIGLIEALDESIVIIEWGDLAKKYITKPYLELKIDFTDDAKTRHLTYKKITPLL